MSGTAAGGAKTARKIKLLYGSDFYATIGQKGGSVIHPETRHFHKHPELARIWGSKGGKISKRVWTAEQRRAHSKAVRGYYKRRKLFEVERPTWYQRLMK